jgi:hypothetical protein
MMRIGWAVGLVLSLAACTEAFDGSITTCQEATTKLTDTCMSNATFMQDCDINPDDHLGCMAACILNTSCMDIATYAQGDKTGTTGMCIASCPDAPPSK